MQLTCHLVKLSATESPCHELSVSAQTAVGERCRATSPSVATTTV